MDNRLRLLVISHTPHYYRESQIVGWGPTVRELDHLSRLFSEVVHLAPIYFEPSPNSSLPYHSKRINFIALPPLGGGHFRAKLDILRNFPFYYRQIREELREVDAVHVRCPANISMLAIILLAMVKSPAFRWVKYAGNWQPKTGTAWTYRFQRWLLVRNLHRGTVSINGRWPGQPAHIYTFHNPSLSASEILEGQKAGATKEITAPLQILFAGELNVSKGVGRALRIVQELQSRGIPLEFNLVGDGEQRSMFEAFAQENHLGQSTHFHGWLPRQELQKYYKRAHILLHPTDSDGWPKVISEAMAYGVVPVAGAVASIPQILTETASGLSFPPHDLPSFIEAIGNYYNQPDLWKTASQAGLEAASNFTYDSYLETVREMFQRSWNVSLKISTNNE